MCCPRHEFLLQRHLPQRHSYILSSKKPKVELSISNKHNMLQHYILITTFAMVGFGECFQLSFSVYDLLLLHQTINNIDINMFGFYFGVSNSVWSINSFLFHMIYLVIFKSMFTHLSSKSNFQKSKTKVLLELIQ